MLLPVILAIVQVLQPGPAFLYQDPATDKAIRSALDATYNMELAAARKVTQGLQSKYPDHPVGYLMEAETYWWEAQIDPTNKLIEQAYERAQEQAVENAERSLKSRKYPEIELNAYLASAYGSKARFQLTQHGAGFGTVRTGMKAHSYARKVYAADPNYIDILVGIGAYNYFADRVPTIIKPFAWLLGASGDAELGFRQMRTAMERGRYGRTEARIVYFTALLKDEQYAEALQVVEKLSADYPNNVALYTWITQWFREQGKNLEGADYFEKLYAQKAASAPRPGQYALFEKAVLQGAHSRHADARQTLARVKSGGAIDGPLARRMEAFEKTLRR